MSDPGTLSNDEILAALKTAQKQQSIAAANHSVSQGIETYFPNDPTQDMGVVDRTRSSIGRGMVSIGRNVGNLVGAVSDKALADANELDAPLLNTRSGSIGNLIGQAAITAPLTMGASMGVGALGKAGAAIAGNPLSRGVLEGGVQGLVSADPGQRMRGTLTGAAAGSVLPIAGAIGGKMMRGVTTTPEAQDLLKRGIDLTPGQMNPEGAMNAVEQAWQSVPVVGNIIKNSRANAESQFQQAAIREGAAPGASVAGNSDLNALLDDAYKSYGPAYDVAKGFPVGPKIMGNTDVPLSQAFSQVAKKARIGLTTDVRDETNNWLQNQLKETITAAKQSGGMQSDHLLELRSIIRSAARDASDSTAAGRATRDLLGDAEDKVTQALGSQLPGDAMTKLAATDAQYSKYKLLENVMRKAGDRPEGFTPFQFSQAIKEGTDAGTYARGGGHLRDMAVAGRNVFNVVSPATGARNAAIGLSLAATAAMPPVGAGALGLIGTQTGRRLAAGMTPPQLLAQQLVGAVPPSAKTITAELARRLSVAPVVSPRLGAYTGNLSPVPQE